MSHIYGPLLECKIASIVTVTVGVQTHNHPHYHLLHHLHRLHHLHVEDVEEEEERERGEGGGEEEMRVGVGVDKARQEHRVPEGEDKMEIRRSNLTDTDLCHIGKSIYMIYTHAYAIRIACVYVNALYVFIQHIGNCIATTTYA